MTKTKKRTVSTTRTDDLQFIQNGLKQQFGSKRSSNQAADYAIQTAAQLMRGELDVLLNSVAVGRSMQMVCDVLAAELPDKKVFYEKDTNKQMYLRIDNKRYGVFNTDLDLAVVANQLQIPEPTKH